MPLTLPEPFRPEAVPFFTSTELAYPDVTFEDLPRNGQTTCRHRVRWEHKEGVELDCGQSRGKTIRYSRGWAKAHYSTLTTTVEASLGTKFIASLGSELTSSYGKSLSIAEEVVQEDRIKFTGKDCFIVNVDVYQLSSLLDIQCEWEKFWTARYWEERDLRVWHERYKHQVSVREAHVQCGCPEPSGHILDSVDIESPKLIMSEPFLLANRVLCFFTLGIYVIAGEMKIFDADGPPPFWPAVSDEPRDWSIDLDESLDQQTAPFSDESLMLPAIVLPSYLRSFLGLEGNVTIPLNFGHPKGQVI